MLYTRGQWGIINAFYSSGPTGKGAPLWEGREAPLTFLLDITSGTIPAKGCVAFLGDEKINPKVPLFHP
jgi:hypothetical protein